MSVPKNIQVTTGGFDPSVGSQNEEYISYDKVSFIDLPAFVFTKQNIEDINDFHPQELPIALYFYPISELALEKPSFIDEDTWTDIQSSSSGFISGNKTVIPKIVFPTEKLCTNGLVNNNESSSGEQTTYDESQKVNEKLYGNTFNWEVNSGAGNVNKSTELKDYGYKYPDLKDGPCHYVNMTTCKNEIYDKDKMFTRVFELNDGGTLKSVGDEEDFTYPLVGVGTSGAACVFVLNFLDNKPMENKGAKKPSILNIEMNDINLYLGKNTDILIEINSVTNSGSLLKSDGSQIPLHAQFKERNTPTILVVYPVWNGIVTTGSIPSNKQVVDTGLYIEGTPDVDINQKCEPKLENFPRKTSTGKDKPEPIIVTDVPVDWGNYVKMTWENASGLFSYMPAFFVPTCKFCVYFKGPGESNDTGGDIDLEYIHEAYPIYAPNGSPYLLYDEGGNEVGARNPIIGEPIKDSEDEDTQTMYYRFTFTIKSIGWNRAALETWGFIHRIKAKGSRLAIRNNNGTFVLNTYPTGAGYKFIGGDSFINYATSVSTSIDQDGASGNIVLDKFALMEQDALPVQSVGGITLSTQFISDEGNNSILVPERIFSGIAMEIKDNVSEGSDTLDISLYGIEKKLEDIKLINVPFWDGDPLHVVISFLSKYGGIKVNYDSTADRRAPLPRSREFSAPAVNFPMGTTVIEAFKTVAEYTNHRFIIQTNGEGYLYGMNGISIPKVCYNGSGTEPVTYDSTQVINIDIQPFLSNIHNSYLTMGLLVDGNTTRQPARNQWLPGTRFSDDVDTYPSIPWMKLYAVSEQGYVTRTRLDKLHNKNMMLGRNAIFTGNITIPGNATFKIYDKIKVDDKTFYITAISQNINCQNKEWTTSLTVAQVPAGTSATTGRSSGDLDYDDD